MSEAANRETVERLIEGLNTRDLELFHAQFHEDSVMEYPQSGERISGGENRRRVYGAFPALPGQCGYVAYAAGGQGVQLAGAG